MSSGAGNRHRVLYLLNARTYTGANRDRDLNGPHEAVVADLNGAQREAGPIAMRRVETTHGRPCAKITLVQIPLT